MFRKKTARGKVIAFANQKGGVGKTTSCVNVAASLQAVGKTVMLVDLDPQGNATMGSGINKNDIDNTINEVLLGEIKIERALITDTPAGYALVPANSNLTLSEVRLLKAHNSQLRLKNALARVRAKFDIIVLDCPPALNMLTLNALVAADSLIIPMQCEYYALEGLSSLLNTLEQVKATLNPELKIEGIVQTMYDPRNKLAQDVGAQLREHFGDKVYNTVIPRNVRLAEAPSHGLPALLYDKQSRGAMAYFALVGEMLAATDNQTAPEVVEGELTEEELTKGELLDV